MDTSERLLKLLSLLQARPDWTGRELAERLDVTGRTVRNDVERLRRLGYPVHASPGVGGGYRLGAGAALPPLLLDDEEAVAVAVGLRTAAGGAVAGIEETSLRALVKLEQVLPSLGETDVLLSTVGGLFPGVTPTGQEPLEAAAVKGDPRMVEVLAAAITDRQLVPEAETLSTSTEWGATSAVEIDRDGRSIWVAERCAAQGIGVTVVDPRWVRPVPIGSMNTRSVKSSQLSGLSRATALSDGASPCAPNWTRLGPIAPRLRKAEAAPGPPLKAKVTGRDAPRPATV